MSNQNKNFNRLNQLSQILIAIIILIQSQFVFATGAASIPHEFQVSATTPPPFPAGPTNILTPAVSIDEWTTLISPSGFSFVFAGQTYGKVVVSTNGWCALVPDTTTTIPTSLTPIDNNQLANNTTTFPIIAPLWDDLSTSVFSWSMSGSELWIRWTVKWSKSNAAAASSLFYVKLDGSNNSISFFYANNTTYTPLNASASIGISSPVTGDYYSVYTTASNNAYVDSITENINIGSMTMRPFNCSYVFTPRQVSTGLLPIDKNTLNAEVFPTVASEEITVKYQLETSSDIRFQIINPQGQVIYTESLDGLVGFNVFYKNIGDIAPGTYYISILATQPEKRFRLASFIKN